MTPEEKLLSELWISGWKGKLPTPHPMGISLNLKNSFPRNLLDDKWPTVRKVTSSSCDLIKRVSANCQLKTVG